jgi:hypothetical protein
LSPGAGQEARRARPNCRIPAAAQTRTIETHLGTQADTFFDTATLAPAARSRLLECDHRERGGLQARAPNRPIHRRPQTRTNCRLVFEGVPGSPTCSRTLCCAASAWPTTQDRWARARPGFRYSPIHASRDSASPPTR